MWFPLGGVKAVRDSQFARRRQLLHARRRDQRRPASANGGLVYVGVLVGLHADDGGGAFPNHEEAVFVVPAHVRAVT